MQDNNQFSVEEIRDWQRLPVTEWFFEIVKSRIDYTDVQVHKDLEFITQDKIYDAALENAALTELKYIMELPNEMIEEIEGEREENEA